MNMLAPCENRTCEHLAALHDIYEPGDPYPTCCAWGCRCGQPGMAHVQRQPDGTVTVLDAPPVIRVARDLLATMAADKSPLWDPAAEVLTLDTAGTHRYEYLRPDPTNERASIFGRVKS